MVPPLPFAPSQGASIVAHTAAATSTLVSAFAILISQGRIAPIAKPDTSASSALLVPAVSTGAYVAMERTATERAHAIRLTQAEPAKSPAHRLKRQRVAPAVNAVGTANAGCVSASLSEVGTERTVTDGATPAVG